MSNGTETVNVQTMSGPDYDTLFDDQTFKFLDTPWTIPVGSTVTYTFNFSSVAQSVKNEMHTASNPDSQIYSSSRWC